MKTWRIAGSQDLAVSPSDALSAGTVRQPRTSAPRLDDLLEALLEAAALDPVARQEDVPARRIRRAPGRAMRTFLQASLRNACGICIRMPAPSPVLASEPAGAAVVEVLEDLDRLLAGSGSTCGPSCPRRSRRRRRRARTTGRRGPASGARRASCARACGRCQVCWALLRGGIFKLGAFFEPNCDSG